MAPEGPAAAAGIAMDDLIVEVAGRPVEGLADFYRKIWAIGEAGVDIPLTVLTGAGLKSVSVRSGDRYDYLKLDPTY